MIFSSGRVLISSLLLLLLLCACSTSAGSQAAVSEKDAGKTFEMKPGGILTITLEGNPSTGYIWEFEALDTNVLKQVGEADFNPDSDAPGSGGMVRMQFEALQPGETQLRLVYHRPWEQDVPPEESFEITVVVN